MNLILKKNSCYCFSKDSKNVDYSSLLPKAILYPNICFKIYGRTLSCLNFDFVRLVGMITVFVWVMGNNVSMAAKCVNNSNKGTCTYIMSFNLFLKYTLI